MPFNLRSNIYLNSITYLVKIQLNQQNSHLFSTIFFLNMAKFQVFLDKFCPTRSSTNYRAASCGRLQTISEIFYFKSWQLVFCLYSKYCVGTFFYLHITHWFIHIYFQICNSILVEKNEAFALLFCNDFLVTFLENIFLVL